MKKFLAKLLIICLLGITPNVTIGVIRALKKDRISYVIHKMTQTHPKELDTCFAVEEMSRDTLGLIIRKTDKYGNSNTTENKKPKILFLGDSFLNDPLLNTDSGIQNLTNMYFGQNVAYSIAQPRRAGFMFYNYLISEHFIEQPKVIICEVVERHLFEAWSELKKTITSDEKADLGDKHYYFMDLVLGNNFADIENSNLFHGKSEKKEVEWHSYNTSGGRVFFYRNQLQTLDEHNTDILLKNLLFTQSYFNSKGVLIYFVIIPDKESLYPEIFGKSNLPNAQQKFINAHLNMIDVYSFISKDRYKYFQPGDSHWSFDAIKVFSGMVNAQIPDSLVKPASRI